MFEDRGGHLNIVGPGYYSNLQHKLQLVNLKFASFLLLMHCLIKERKHAKLERYCIVCLGWSESL